MKHKVPFLVSVTLGIWLCSQGCMFVHDTDCETDSDCYGGTCSSGACVGSDGASEYNGGSTPSGGKPASCSTNTFYCQNNSVYRCSTATLVRSCSSCKYIGPGTGSSYDTTCQATPQAGCYFGSGPPICSAGL